MHSSRMRTGRTLTVFRSLLFPVGGRGVSGPRRGVWSQGGVWSGGVWSRRGVWSQEGTCLVWGYLPGLGVPAWSGGVSPWSEGGSCLVWGVPAWSWGVCVSGPGVCTCLVWGGVPAWSGGVYLPSPGGVPAWSQGSAWSGTPPPRQNDTRL